MTRDPATMGTASQAFRVDEHLVYVLHYDREGVLRDFDFGPAPR